MQSNGPTQTRAVTIDERYCGPPRSANGGYVAGLMAEALGPYEPGPVQVTLRKPPPLGQALQLVVAGSDTPRAELRDGEALLAEAVPAPLDLTVPAAPTLAEATHMAEHYAGFEDSAYGRCFVCGVDRAEGDGLRIFAGRAPHSASAVMAAPFTPTQDGTEDGSANSTEDDVVRPAILWSALDCPGYFAVREGTEIAVLGRMTAELVRPARPGQPLVVIGFPLAREGRKLFAGTALFDADGNLVGRAHQTWIRLQQPAGDVLRSP